MQIKTPPMKDYTVYKSQIVLDKHEELIRQIIIAHHTFKKYFPDRDSTLGYSFYNIFSITSPSPLFYDILQELKRELRQFIGHNDRLWFQSWANYHMPNEVLDWHNHEWPWHGYISIDPKKTKTVFEGYEIINELGNVYIGPGYRKHKVVVLEPFYSPRITLGFDIETNPGPSHKLFSLIPL
jgi:hypothetical protein